MMNIVMWFQIYIHSEWKFNDINYAAGILLLPGATCAMHRYTHWTLQNTFEMEAQCTVLAHLLAHETKTKSYLTQKSHKIIYERMLLTVYRTPIKMNTKQERVCCMLDESGARCARQRKYTATTCTQYVFPFRSIKEKKGCLNRMTFYVLIVAVG